MKNSYKVVVKSNQGNAKTTTHDVPEPGSWWGALKIKAVPGARYQLIDNTTGQGPDNIRVKRAGNDLRISFEGREEADLVISDYYEYTEPGFAALIGEADPGVFHAYLPESGQTSALVGNLPDGASNVGMALGGEQVGASGAAVGALVAVAGFNPLLAAPLALLGAGGGGGGGADGASGTGTGTGTSGGSGSGVPDTTPPVLSLKKMTQAEFDFDKNDFLTNVAKPEFEGTITNYNAATQKLLVQVVGITGTTLDFAYITPNATTGAWVFKPSIDLDGNNAQYLFRATLVDNAGNILKIFDQSFGVDRVVPLFEMDFWSTTGNQAWGPPVSADSSELGRYWAASTANNNLSDSVQLASAITSEGIFALGFWDLAGNAANTLTSADNPQTTGVVDPWTFSQNVDVINLKQTGLTAIYKTPKAFGDGALAGSVGRLEFEQGQETTVNLVDRYQLTPAVNSVSAVNHIVMTDGVGNDTLKLTMGDVLALGVKDSFVSNGHRQMRIDGDVDDKVLLDNLVGSSTVQAWSQQPNQLPDMPSYNVYSNAYWGLDLFIKQGIEVL